MSKIKKLSPDYSQLINEGGFGDVYRCKEDDKVIIKLIKKLDKKYSGETNKKIIKKLFKHNSLMNILGINKSKYNNIYLIYLENINGISLSKYLKQKYIEKFNNQNNIIINIINQILSGLNYLHNNKITHRDIKLDNIMIDPNNNKIKIIDFGLACYGYPCKDIVGTSGFFAPEMIYDSQNYNSKCDIWSLGCVLYYIVCRTLPFYFTHDKNCYIQQLSDSVNIHFDDHKWSNKSLQKLCYNMLIYNYHQRFSANDSSNLIKTYQ